MGENSRQSVQPDPTSIHLPGFDKLPPDMREALDALYQQGGEVLDRFLVAIDA